METRFKLTRIPRTVGFCHSLKNEVEDLEDACDFVKKEQLESEDKDNVNTPEQEFKELTAEDMGKANNALQAHKLIIAEIKKKIEHELYMAEAAATASWGAVAVPEDKEGDGDLHQRAEAAQEGGDWQQALQAQEAPRPAPRPRPQEVRRGAPRIRRLRGLRSHGWAERTGWLRAELRGRRRFQGAW